MLYGEIYGKVKGYAYDAPIVQGQPTRRLRVFDARSDDGDWLPFSWTMGLCHDLGVATVPHLGMETWDPTKGIDAFSHYAEGPSTLNPGHHPRGRGHPP